MFFIPYDNSSPYDSNWLVLNVHGLKVSLFHWNYFTVPINLTFPQWHMQPILSLLLQTALTLWASLSPSYITWLLCEFYFCHMCNSYLILLPLQSFRNSMWHTFKNTVPNDPISFFSWQSSKTQLLVKKRLREFFRIILLQNSLQISP